MELSVYFLLVDLGDSELGLEPCQNDTVSVWVCSGFGIEMEYLVAIPKKVRDRFFIDFNLLFRKQGGRGGQQGRFISCLFVLLSKHYIFQTY